MPINIPDTRPASATTIARLQDALGAGLPASLRAFLARHDGAEPEPNIVRVGAAGASSVRAFIPADEMLARRRHVDGFPAGALPIAADDSGNYFYLRGDGSLWFWDHEAEDGDVRVATDFDAFLNGLSSPSAGDDIPEPQVSGTWTKPGFKPVF